jgi:Amt family ammonium transporter
MIGALLLPVLSLSILGGTGLPGGHSLSEQIGIQAIAVLVSAGWSVGISFGLLKLIDALTGLRVSADEETEGLDLSSHNGKGYHF